MYPFPQPVCLVREKDVKLSSYPCYNDLFATFVLEDSIHDVATDGGTGAKNRGIAHLLSELLAVLFELARLLTLDGGHCTAGLADV